MSLLANRRVLDDWFDGVVPACVQVDPEAHIESAFSFAVCRARAEHAVQIGRAAHVYSSTIFDVGERGRVQVGAFAMLNGVRLICEARIEIGAYAAISWNVMLMDSYRLPLDPARRRSVVERARGPLHALLDPDAPARPICLQDNVWLGFDVCVLPGVTIGEGSVVGAGSVVCTDVPAYTLVAGNPARPVRELPRPERNAEQAP
ncbi:MAG TPA: acyltransferase [Polyangiales bacterium]|nr:acyltransferase [Polyangiales bacterium]